MDKTEFRLTPAYCLFNGVGIREQNEYEIVYLLENLNDEILRKRLKKAFFDHLGNIHGIHGDFSQKVNEKASVSFIKGTRNQIRKYVSSLYENDFGKCEAKEEKSKNNNEEAAAVILLDRILSEGREKKATDIHIEKESIRFRINGCLETEMKIKGKAYDQLIQRIKILGGMNVLEKKKSQDGHFVYGNRNPLFVRVSSVAVIGENYSGEESVVLRLLDTSRIPLTVDYLGFNEEQLQKISELVSLRNGLVLVCGPTGSGKSTTVASMLIEIEKKTNNKLKIISLEDPPEYIIPGVTQIKVGNGGNDYKNALDHIFRLDPDVIMIGEIRDEKSGMAAVKAALTGHLVFATLHTGSVSESILRMESLGIERIMLGAVLRGVVCQELNYLGDEIKLYGDIGIPVKNFSSKISKNSSEDDLENLFLHTTNYSELLSRTLELLAQRNSEAGKESTVQQLWRNNKNNGKVHKKIV